MSPGEAGPPNNGDVTAINALCEVIKPPFEYGLIVNQVHKKNEGGILNKALEKVLETFLNRLSKKPSATTFLKFDAEMENDEKPFLSAQDEDRIKLLDFIASLESYRIRPNDIGNFP